jgi:hypothetical protein
MAHHDSVPRDVQILLALQQLTRAREEPHVGASSGELALRDEPASDDAPLREPSLDGEEWGALVRGQLLRA